METTYLRLGLFAAAHEGARAGRRRRRPAPGRRGPRAAPRPRRIADEHGATVRHFDVGHTKRMHVIVARRDLTGFQHLHPTQRADGTWETPVTLRDAGSYRLFADFSRDGEPQTPATDLRVDGRADLRELPAPVPVSDGGSDVELAAGNAHPGDEADLAFLHVHPTNEAGSDEIGFAATFPTEGRYRLFLQFQRASAVQTVAFTQEVGR